MSVPLRVQNGYKQCFNEAVFILEVGMRISAYFTVLQTTLLLSLLTPALLGGQRRAGVSSRVVCSEVCGNQCAEIHLPTFNWYLAGCSWVLTLLSLRRQWIECAALYWPGDVLGGGLYRRRGSARVTGPWSSWPLTGSSECETGPRGRNTPWMRMSLEVSLWEISLIGCLCLVKLWHMKGCGRKTSKIGKDHRLKGCIIWLSHLRSISLRGIGAIARPFCCYQKILHKV